MNPNYYPAGTHAISRMDPPARALGVGEGAGAMAETIGQITGTISSFDCETVESVTAAIDGLRDDGFDCVVLGPHLDDGVERPAVDRIREVAPDVPLVALVASADCERTEDLLTRDAVEVASVDVAESNPMVLAARIENTIQRYRNERELEQYETLVRAIPDEIYTLDDEGRVTSIVPPAGHETTTTGYRPDELIGEPIELLMEDEDVAFGEQLIRGLLTSEDRDRASFEMDVISRDGTRLPRENHIALLPMEDDESFRGTVGVLRDVTERRERERELQRQNERLEQFAHIASHDLRNPLNVAEGRLALAQHDCDSEHLEHVERALDRMETLVDDTLTMAKGGQTVSSVETVDLTDLATHCWAAVPTGEATIEVDADVTVEGDPERLTRVLENLFRNAVEHGGPAVTVRVGPLDGGFYVADDGEGIPADERDEVFEAGHTTAADGTGFGLAIVQEIVQAHGWTIDVCESEAGGTRFEITGVD